MANGRFSQSRSPIRAIAAASHPIAGISTTQPRPWRDIVPHEGASDSSYEADDFGELQAQALCCPECGKSLQLQLQAQASQAIPQGAPNLAPPRLRGSIEQFDDAVNAYKRELLTRALDKNGGVMTRAAKAVGLKYTTFVAMAHRLGITKDGSRGDEAGSFGL